MNKEEEKELDRIRRDIKVLKRKRWHQRWWGMFIIGVWAGVLVAVLQIAASVLIVAR